MIYLDNAATTRLDDNVWEAMTPWFREEYGNASSLYALGRRARVMVENAREEIAALIGAHPAELIFTSGGTESDNAALKSSVEESGLVDTVVTSAIEHHAVSHSAEELARRGVAVRFLPTDENGRARAEAGVSWNGARTLASLMTANNETGAIQPVAALREFMPDSLLHTDAVQAFGKIPFDVRKLGVDFATVSAHKIHGPKGVGALFIRRGINFKAHQHGGAQERNRRAGTEATALIAGFVAAARSAAREMETRSAVMRERITLLESLLQNALPALRVNTPKEDVLPNILNVSFADAERLDGEAILQALDMRGIAVSNGSACVSGAQQPSHVLLAIGRSEAEAKAAVRFSVSKDTTEQEIRAAAQTLAEIVKEMRES